MTDMTDEHTGRQHLVRADQDRGVRRASRTFAGLATVAALTLGAAACGSDDGDPGGDDPVEVPDDTTVVDTAPMDTTPVDTAPMDTSVEE